MIPVITPARPEVKFQLASAAHVISNEREVVYRGYGSMAECIADANKLHDLSGCTIDGMTIGAALDMEQGEFVPTNGLEEIGLK